MHKLAYFKIFSWIWALIGMWSHDRDKYLLIYILACMNVNGLNSHMSALCSEPLLICRSEDPQLRRPAPLFIINHPIISRSDAQWLKQSYKEEITSQDWHNTASASSTTETNKQMTNCMWSKPGWTQQSAKY